MTAARLASAAFAAAFFFLALSKPLTFVALGVAAIALLVDRRAMASVRVSSAAPDATAASTAPAAPGASEAFGAFGAPAWWLPLLALAALPALSIALHDDGPGNLQYLSLGYLWLVALLVHAGAHRTRDVALWLAAYLAGTTLVWIHLCLASIGLPLLPNRPAAGGNYILVSQFLAMGLVIAAMLHRHDPRPRARFAYRVALVAMAVGLATGDGRTGTAVAIALLPLIATALLPGRGRAVLIAGCLVGAAVILASPHARERIGRVAQDVAHWQRDASARLRHDDDRQNSIGLRLEMWRTAAGLAAAHPIAGAGPQAFQRAWWQRFPDPDERFAEPHNAYLFYAAAYGVPGLVAFLALAVALARLGWRHRHRLAGGVVLGLAVMLVLAAISNTLVLGTTSLLMLAMLAGLAGAAAPEGVSAARPDPTR